MGTVKSNLIGSQKSLDVLKRMGRVNWMTSDKNVVNIEVFVGVFSLSFLSCQEGNPTRCMGNMM